MLNFGNVNFNDATAPNTVLKLKNVGSGQMNSIDASLLTDDGTTLKYNGVALAGSSGLVAPTTIYSAAGTPLPAASAALKGASAVVSDATTPTYGGTYTSGGAVVARVLCNGSAWVTM